MLYVETVVRVERRVVVKVVRRDIRGEEEEGSESKEGWWLEEGIVDFFE